MSPSFTWVSFPSPMIGGVFIDPSGSLLTSPKPPHFLQTSKPPGFLRNFPFPLQAGQTTILYFPKLKVSLISIPSFFPVSRVWHPAGSYQLPVLQNHWVDNLSADNTFPSPEVLMGAIKFIINHEAIAAKTLHKDVFFLPAFSIIIGKSGLELNKVNTVFYGKKGCIFGDSLRGHRKDKQGVEIYSAVSARIN
jgi:hypothetical protein